MILILYGSQTGTGIHLSKLLAQAIGSDAVVLQMDSFDITKLLDLRFVIFICPTHGDGQCPFNIVRFWAAITSDIPPVFKFEYAVLGLGDSRYEKYNWCAKMLYNRLEQLGATPLLKVLANTQDQGGVYDGYYRFEREILKLIYIRSSPVDNISLTISHLYFGSGSDNKETASTCDASKLVEYGLKCLTEPYKATVIFCKLVTNPEYEKKVVEILFDIPDYCDYLPGDCLGIFPENPPNLLDGFDFSEEEKKYLLKNIDLNSVPHQTSFNQLAELTEDREKRDKLKEIATDYDLYHSYAVIAKRTILEILKEFSISPTYEFMASLSEIYPRYYSFTMIKGKYYSVLINIIDYKTYIAKPRVGLCSEYLRSLTGTINVEIVPSRLYMNAKNLLFFSTGTGITLPRSVLHFFSGKNMRIYYGFRHYDSDFLCKDEFLGCALYPAASVDDGKHVMDVYRETPVDNIDDWLVFVSGNSGLNKNIRKLLCDVHGKDVQFQSETW
ncbi:hypothetical protein PAEPH01_0313 [Pancytospora epiphaga]|nr:hypothetical protein PAEPH01_0313 [Pancytospora epiphaga]